MLRQCVSWINTPQGGRTGTETEKERRTKTKFQTCNLSNPQSCENDWREKGEERREKMEGRELERGLISN